MTERSWGQRRRACRKEPQAVPALKPLTNLGQGAADSEAPDGMTGNGIVLTLTDTKRVRPRWYACLFARKSTDCIRICICQYTLFTERQPEWYPMVPGRCPVVPGRCPMVPGRCPMVPRRHHCFGALFLSFGALLATGATMTRFGLGLLVYPFSAIIW